MSKRLTHGERRLQRRKRRDEQVYELLRQMERSGQYLEYRVDKLELMALDLERAQKRKK